MEAAYTEFRSFRMLRKLRTGGGGPSPTPNKTKKQGKAQDHQPVSLSITMCRSGMWPPSPSCTRVHLDGRIIIHWSCRSCALAYGNWWAPTSCIFSLIYLLYIIAPTRRRDAWCSRVIDRGVRWGSIRSHICGTCKSRWYFRFKRCTFFVQRLRVIYSREQPPTWFTSRWNKPLTNLSYLQRFDPITTTIRYRVCFQTCEPSYKRVSQVTRYFTLPLNHNLSKLRLFLKSSSCLTTSGLVNPSASWSKVETSWTSRSPWETRSLTKW